MGWQRGWRWGSMQPLPDAAVHRDGPLGPSGLQLIKEVMAELVVNWVHAGLAQQQPVLHQISWPRQVIPAILQDISHSCRKGTASVLRSDAVTSICRSSRAHWPSSAHRRHVLQQRCYAQPPYKCPARFGDMALTSPHRPLSEAPSCACK